MYGLSPLNCWNKNDFFSFFPSVAVFNRKEIKKKCLTSSTNKSKKKGYKCDFC